MTAARFLTVEQIRDELGVSLKGAYRAAHQMRPVRVGNLLRVERCDFDDFVHWPRAVRRQPHRGIPCGGHPARLDAIDGHVYVVEAVGTDRAKVGWTRRGVAGRLVTLQTSSPFELVVRLEVAGSRDLEFACHRTLAGTRVRPTTEWFHGVAATVASVASLHACAVERRPWAPFSCEASP